jgi:large subunit ribosomal protein L1
MNQKEAEAMLKELKNNSTKRNFKQSIDFIISLKNMNLKKPDQHVDFFTTLHFPVHKELKVCGLVGSELFDQSKEVFDKTIFVDDLAAMNDKKELKKIANEYDYFVAQGNIMGKVAGTFGKVLGPRGKMPNPKAGCVVPPNANLNQVKENLKKLLHIQVKSHLMFQSTIGTEDTEDKILIDNMVTIYSQLMHHLPLEKNNIDDVMVKFTMSKPVKLSTLKA